MSLMLAHFPAKVLICFIYIRIWTIIIIFLCLVLQKGYLHIHTFVLCYGYKPSTGTVRRLLYQTIVWHYRAYTAGGRNTRKIKENVSTSFGVRWSLGTTIKLTAPVRRCVGSLKWHWPGTVQFPNIARQMCGSAGRFCFKFKSTDFKVDRPGTLRQPVGNCTVFEMSQELSKIP